MSDSLVTQWTIGCQAPLFMRFPRQEHWSGLPFPSPGNFPDPGMKPTPPTLAGEFSTAEPWRNPIQICTLMLYHCVWWLSVFSLSHNHLWEQGVHSVGFISLAQCKVWFRHKHLLTRWLYEHFCRKMILPYVVSRYCLTKKNILLIHSLIHNQCQQLIRLYIHPTPKP